MPDRSRKRPQDPNQLAKLVVDLATGEAQESGPSVGKTQLPWPWDARAASRVGRHAPRS